MGTFTFVAAGDAILNRRISVYEEDGFLEMIDIIDDADLSVINLETLLHEYEGYPSANGPGTYMRSPPWVADELTWAGFDAFVAATNHTMDYSHGGMMATMRELEARNVPYAGLGENLAEARAPAYVETPNGRAAIVSACSTITTGSIAGKQRPDMKGRPGLSPLRLETRYQVPEHVYEDITALSSKLGLEGIKQQREELGFPIRGYDDESFRLLNLGGDRHPAFEKSDTYGVEQEVHEEDRRELIERIEAATRQADWTIVSLHSHEGVGGSFNDDSVPPFLESFARSCIDAGADAFFGHGPHLLRGAEIYDGAPIFYSLGNFFMQNETIPFIPSEMYARYNLDAAAMPADVFDTRVYENGNRTGFLGDRAYWESVLPVCTFGSDRLETVTLYPVDLMFDEPRPRRGRPLLAEGEKARSILNRFEQLSGAYGTEVRIEDQIGLIDLT